MESGKENCSSPTNISRIDGISDPFLQNSSEGLRIFAGLATMVIIALGVLGNVLTIAALIKCPKIRNLTVAFITSLCVSDLSFCVLVMPWSVCRFLRGRNCFDEDHVLCILHPLIQYASVGVSFLSIAMITINRFVMIAWQSMYNRIYTRTSVAAMVVFIWLFSFAILIPTLTKKWGEFGYDYCLGSCSVIGPEETKTALFLIGFLVPFIAIVACYAGIFWVVHRSRSRVQGHAEANKGRTGNDWRLTKMILAIFLSFLLCYLPISIIKTVDKHTKRPDAHLVGYVLIYLSACINPIIYVTMNRQYRQAYKSVLFSCWTTTQPVNTNSASEKGHHRTVVSTVSGHVHHPQSIDIPLSSMTR